MPNKKPIQHTQDNDLSHSMVHYLLIIHKLKEMKGYARVTDISKSLNLTKGSVSTAIKNLKKKGLVAEEDDSKFLYLTDLGHDEVHGILSARTLLFYFLKDVLKVEEEIAHNDSCLMEHLLSSETREKFFYFMKNFSSTNANVVESKEIFKTSLDLSVYETEEDFLLSQKGDTYLK